jgi:hypothetical protein
MRVECPAIDDCAAFAAVNVSVVVGEEDSPDTTLTEVGLSEQVGAVAADGGWPMIDGEMLQESVTFPVSPGRG